MGRTKIGPTASAWSRIDEELRIGDQVRENGHVIIPMNDLKRAGQREIRLLMKQDRRSQVPSFLDGGGALSVSNKEVLFYYEDLHVDLPTISAADTMTVHLKEAQLPPLINPWMITSEPQAIAVVENLGLLEKFLGEKPISVPTGRHHLHSPIEMKINSLDGGTTQVQIDNPQVESDAWQVGSDHVHVLEAKHGNTTELHSRQLFYPYHDMRARLREEGRSHQVSPIVLRSRSPGAFDLYRFEFEDSTDILSSRITNMMSFEIIREDPGSEGIIASSRKPNYEAPFPQADDLGLVLRTVKLLACNADRYEWEYEIGYTSRQFDYYFNAAKWLGLTSGSPSNPVVTDLGFRLLRSRPEDHRREIAGILANDWAFSVGMESGLDFIVEAVEEEILLHESEYRASKENTARRRAKTVRRWLVSLGTHQ